MCVCVYACALSFVEKVAECEMLFVVYRSTHQTHLMTLHGVLQFNTLWLVSMCETACFKSCDFSVHTAYANICLISFNLTLQSMTSTAYAKVLNTWIFTSKSNGSTMNTSVTCRPSRVFPRSILCKWPLIFHTPVHAEMYKNATLITVRSKHSCAHMVHYT